MNALSFTKLLGVALVTIGIAGFFTGSTLIVFQVDYIHNIFHIVTGVLAFIAAARERPQFMLLILGLAYTFITVVGLINFGDIFGVTEVNTADNFLHIVIAIGCLYFGLTTQKNKAVPSEPSPTPEAPSDQ